MKVKECPACNHPIVGERKVIIVIRGVHYCILCTMAADTKATIYYLLKGSVHVKK